MKIREKAKRGNEERILTNEKGTEKTVQTRQAKKAITTLDLTAIAYILLGAGLRLAVV